MTQEEKAKVYDKAIEELRGLLEGVHEEKCDIMEEDIIKIFPELKKSDDERIRKVLIFHFQDNGYLCNKEGNISNTDIVAWLEKQKPSSCTNEKGIVPKREATGVLKELLDKEESEDERIRKGLINYFNDFSLSTFGGLDPKKILAWLEKQGQVKDSTISQHENKTCKENDNSLTSEDKRIKEKLITRFKGYDDKESFGGIKIKDILSWLEKQEEDTYDYKRVDLDKFDDRIQEFSDSLEDEPKPYWDGWYEAMEWVRTHGNPFEKQDKLMEALQISNSRIAELVEEKYNLEEKLEKQGEKKPCMIQWKGDNLKEVIGFTGKDKNFDKWFKSFEEYEKYVHGHNDIFKLFNEDGSHYEVPVGAWIVKTPDSHNVASKSVFKQKPTDKVESKFKVGDVIRLKDGDGLEWTVENVHKNGYYTIINSDRDDFIYLDDNWEIINQKVEPKFHKGEWIVWQGKCYKVNYNGCGYELVDQNGLSTSLEYGTIDENAHLWDITKDAKDGNVLSCESGWTCIFKALNSDISFSSYCFMDADGWFCETGSECHILNEDFVKAYNGELHPATKEQRDQLEKAMADAGYTFDFDKKELKKIVDKKQIKKNLQDNSFRRMFEQKTAWSEEDKGKLETIIDAAESHCFLTLDDIDWLKSLKDRCTWKPSYWQIEAIKDAIKHYNSLGYNASILKELLNELDKLKG